jgi:hypothetical protein
MGEQLPRESGMLEKRLLRPEGGQAPSENLNLRILLRTVSQGVLVRVLIDADPAGFDDPEVASDRWLQARDQRSDGVLEIPRQRLTRQPQHGNARVVCRSIPKWVTELKIESNETPLLLQRSLDNPIVAGGAEDLLVDCRDIVASSFEEGLRLAPKVLVELEFQWVSPRGTST